MLKQRVITATLMLFVSVVFLWMIPQWLPVLVVAVLAMMAWEWARLVQLTRQLVYGYVVLILGLFAIPWLLFDGLPTLQLWGTHPVWQWVNGVVIVGIIGAVIDYARNGRWSVHWQRIGQLLGIYWLINFAWVVLLIVEQQGVWWLLFVISLVATMDIAAYFTGKRWGKTKLAPRVSPGKTWEGVVGGGLAVTLLAVVVAIIDDMNPWVFGMMGALIGLLSIFGDLFESALKRQAGVKDSSQLLPGHGGWLDRFDAMLLALPLYWLLLPWMMV